MRNFNTFVEQREAALVDFETFLLENHPELHEAWQDSLKNAWGQARGMLGAGARAAGRGLTRLGQAAAGGVGQTVGGLGGAASAALQGHGQDAMANLKQAATGAANLATSPLQGVAQGKQAYMNRDMNAVQSIIRTVQDKDLQGGLQQVLDQWLQSRGGPAGSQSILGVPQGGYQQGQVFPTAAPPVAPGMGATGTGP